MAGALENTYSIFMGTCSVRSQEIMEHCLCGEPWKTLRLAAPAIQSCDVLSIPHEVLTHLTLMFAIVSWESPASMNDHAMLTPFATVKV